jgi:hypothetical protein
VAVQAGDVGFVKDPAQDDIHFAED